MITSMHPALSITTFLTPGQKFEPVDSAEHANESLTVARLVKDRHGMLHVTLRTSSGREISAFARQIEIAVSEGHLIPISDSSSTVAC